MSRVHASARDAQGRVKEYLSAEMLAEVTQWTVEAIDAKRKRGELVKGQHWFQRGGPGTEVTFKWSAIVALIEGAGSERPPAAPAARGKRRRRRLDVEKAKEAIVRGLRGTASS
jgi:hypothetical protein